MTINCKGKLIDVTTPKVMGILNLTPDSFYDGGKYKNESDILSQVGSMLKYEATFIDIGAYSSRPNATHISEAEELQRLLPIIELLIKEFPEIIISTDTFRSEVAKQAIQAGAALINDISAGKLDENMLQTVANLQVPYIMMHMKGTPQNMKAQANYKDIMKELLFYFSERIEEAKKLGIKDIIVDPGFGFAKNTTQNFEVLKQFELLKLLDFPILAGISRKSMIYKTLNNTAKEALNGTTVLNTVALQKGANILRVHDVKEATETIKLIAQLTN
ncbi:dihydropteroate synthase [Lacinutrix himadriensis]|uniref:dihydropteroate synthase n=1 Tax=Lacinutrix himadriensis TaxID=641549 RepID=UPI0006E29BF2|nr:dihydropteroate synthase [Lacinutrix himadriensis]